MYELCPYFTNDGTVGLFSKDDDDIYHSTYGALTESWQKFIIPSGLEQYIKTHNEVKILDICYGIGYNTKTALQVFINQALKSQKNIINNDKNKYKNEKFSSDMNSNISAIHSDNISEYDSNINLSKNSPVAINYNEEVYTDNIKQGEISKLESYDVKNSQNVKRILIDAVDSDRILIDLSPFISRGIKNRLFFNKHFLEKQFKSNIVQDKIIQIQKIKKLKIKLPKKKFRLREEVSIIILEKLLKQLKKKDSSVNDKILQIILTKKKHTPFFSKYMINFARFYQNQGCNDNKKPNLSTFLHNIYYQYISKSYKNVKKLSKNNSIDLNFHANDARAFIQSTHNTYNFIFLDAFTPAKCPALWTIQFFKELYLRLEDDGMILTYSNSATIRNAFIKNGFIVGKTLDSISGKFVGTVAVKNEKLIEHKLDEKDWNLINSRAGICFEDESLDLDNSTIIKNRENKVKESDLVSSTKVLKGYKK